MLTYRGLPKIYRQNDTWHVRVYVPKSVVSLVGKSEIHRSLKTTDRREAQESAFEERKKQYAWFNDLHQRQSKRTTIVENLSELQIGEIARSVYSDYQSEVMDEYIETLSLSSTKPDSQSIAASERDAILREMLDQFQLNETAKDYADRELKRRFLSLAPDNQSYGKLIQRIRDAFIQTHVDFVNNLANTPTRGNNPYFIDPSTQEPIQSLGSRAGSLSASYELSKLATDFVQEIRGSRRTKGVAKIQNTMDLMLDHFGLGADIREIKRPQVIQFRDQLRKLPANATKRYPGMNMSKAIANRKPQHETLSISSVNTHIRNLIQFFTTCSLNDENYRTPNLAKIIINDPVDAKDKRNSFAAEHLLTLFSSDWLETAASARNVFFWCCVIGLYHGLRANEITGLSPKDIIEKQGCLYIDLKLPRRLADGQAVGRSKTIPRLIPIHPILLHLDFSKFVLSAMGNEYLFADLREDADGYRSDDISDEMSRLISKIGLRGKKLSFHSFRHTFKDAADSAEISELATAYLGGWKVKGIMHSSYGSKEMKPTIIPAIRKITYGEIDKLVLEIGSA